MEIDENKTADQLATEGSPNPFTRPEPKLRIST
jgi:hypothetical protein